MSPPAIPRFAPAKINLALHVTGQREDGYHLLDSLVAFAAHGDGIAVSPAEADTFTVSGAHASELPLDGGNLVLKARDALRTIAGPSTSPVAIHLDKALPVASGVGGGSSDAAATLLALRDIWSLAINDAELARLGLTLGADLPMCLAARSARIRGIGETVEPVMLPPLAAVLANPGVAVSTPAVFAHLTTRENAPLPDLPEGTDRAIWLDWLRTTRNDLQPPAMTLAPEIGATLDALDAAGAEFTRMSGSGATCFGLFVDAAQANDAAARLTRAYPGWYVQPTVLSQEARP